ncbi:Rieske (2Fe-2S) protein [Streptomyces boncukensis]|uniref:Cytochrome bc1 complex Rieske iron-sulfur subunit n=1 Tax=Streptomyces boncukensis TaxID=2711219 RepID=A0A6G4WVV6_9ACTN|nr:Rieske (2Fe-2S) protein [Streptomyces boncukensis]NGO69419.1 Rieske (2Fe-2S) protein [Streptomyces boncukensis]
MSHPLTSRRSVLAAAGLAGLAGTLSACGDSDDDSPGEDAQKSPDTQESPESGDDSGDGDEDSDGGDGDGDEGGAELGQAADIPEGGGQVFKDRKVVVTQPRKGEFKGYSATCTHQGCLVKEVADGTINCACHGSKFDIADGSVRTGPATRSLPTRDVTVRDGTLRLD